MVYICAGLSRFGPNIDSGMSRQLILELLSMCRLAHIANDASLLTSICVLMTATEILAGMLLIGRRTSRTGSMIALLMHCILIILLSPAGLNHEPGVLIWNTFFVACHLLLLTNSRVKSAQQSEGNNAAERRQLAPTSILLLLGIVIFPLSGLVGFADNWLGWQLYSPRPEVLKIYVRVDAVSQLPDSLQPFVDPPTPLDDWCPVRLDRWSLEQVHAPIYPEDRFQISVARHLATFVESADDIKAELEFPSTPDWWNRKTQPVSVKESQ